MSGKQTIAKNTVFLYARTALTMLISLYASRVILEQLGISDYGVYNVVGGFVAMFNALSAPLAGATQRFITYAIGTKNQKEIRKVFSTCVYIHIVLAVVVVLVIEIIGIWYINAKMNIPIDRLFAAKIVFHASALSLFFSIACIPYSAAVVANEKFGYYAWCSVLQAIIRLLLIICLPFINGDKLILYAFFELFLAISIQIAYIVYSLNRLTGCELIMANDKTLYKRIITFSGWNILGTSSNVIYTQGSNLILNAFFGVLLNAAMGVTHQVMNAVSSFVSNFTLAVNPQITKSFAAGEISRANNLVFFGSKIASFLLLIVGFPIITNIHYILNIWLVEVPKFAECFIILAILSSFMGAFTSSMNNLIFATGNIKFYQIGCAIINVVGIVVLYVSFLFHAHPACIYIISILQGMLKVMLLAGLLKINCHFPMWSYIKKIYIKNLLFLLPIALTLYLKSRFDYQLSFIRFIIESGFCVLFMSLLIWILGLDKEERTAITGFVKLKTAK